MNDRFKFRVWDKYTHETPAEQMQFLCFNGCLVDSDGCYHSPDDYIVEQCTGLKDKNGNLIYEGDIVKAVTGTYKVIWDRHRWAIKNSQGYIFSEYINDLLYDCEIIGNIHKQAEQKD